MRITQSAVPLVIRERAPGASDSGYVIGTIWMDKIHHCSYECLDSTSGAAIWRLISYRITILTITAKIAANTNFSTTSSGTGYTKSGDDGYLLESEALFNDSREIQIFLNGVMQKKGFEAIWKANVTFQLNIIVDTDDEIIILT